ncbi:Hypothetical predicted protein [Marmota monax]|uniref:Uncharacterized protein n=1 Tax=Marmota monax TaxID=9995 RepID=A0A5E4AUV9_MARMO|nr:hypothetical protein GHT09_013672 [Marmota monax]VTJ60501.1 Hypothetical predicted protein [Marmota monax]
MGLGRKWKTEPIRFYYFIICLITSVYEVFSCKETKYTVFLSLKKFLHYCKKTPIWSGMVVNSCELRRLRQEDCKFQASFSNLARPKQLSETLSKLQIKRAEVVTQW